MTTLIGLMAAHHSLEEYVAVKIGEGPMMEYKWNEALREAEEERERTTAVATGKGENSDANVLAQSRAIAPPGPCARQ